MTDDIDLTVSTEDAVLERGGDTEEREIDLRIVPWGVVASTPQGREMFVRGAFDGVDPTRVTIESQRHGGPLVGRGVSIEQRDDGAYLRAAISRIAAGDDLLVLSRDGTLRDASVSFRPVEGGSRRRADGVIERTRVDLRRVAVVERGTYPGAAVLAVRAEEDIPMENEITMDGIREAVRGIVADAIPAPIVQVPAPDEPEASLLSRTTSFSDLYERVLGGDHDLVRALADEVTGDVPEIVRPSWLNTILGILPAVRPAVSAFGRDPLPPSGMTVSWPTFAGNTDNPALRVAVQATEKTDIISAKIVLGEDAAVVKTYAGGLDVSWQTLRRSSPAFRDAALRILTTAWAQVTDKAFCADLWTKGTSGPIVPVTVTGDQVHAALMTASAMVDDATGAPASIVLAAPDAWLKLANAAGLAVSPYGFQNVPGTTSASSLSVSISGLQIVRDRNLGTGQIIVGNGLAASWMEDGMFTAEQDVVAKLGTDVAVWSLGAPAVFVPTGVIKMTIAAATGRAAADKS